MARIRKQQLDSTRAALAALSLSLPGVLALPVAATAAQIVYSSGLVLLLS